MYTMLYMLCMLSVAYIAYMAYTINIAYTRPSSKSMEVLYMLYNHTTHRSDLAAKHCKHTTHSSDMAAKQYKHTTHMSDIAAKHCKHTTHRSDIAAKQYKHTTHRNDIGAINTHKQLFRVLLLLHRNIRFCMKETITKILPAFFQTILSSFAYVALECQSQ